jgi:hypothetical protein
MNSKNSINFYPKFSSSTFAVEIFVGLVYVWNLPLLDGHQIVVSEI